ncbi:hypothetical protein LOTGIDRAFT_170480 [Lottia gigantea]|uniref:Uncharacterized protein n=1 Tax=Lottia gigantea TaxID=225164 RepID=V4B159_LOTGI|nr:hypothetical protein LOTGIDRAFT_170480 [Lottia gigantea]ESO81939.1 hypothetical protein LOTGIDRAFT_170480 [Lottia gigantea]
MTPRMLSICTVQIEVLIVVLSGISGFNTPWIGLYWSSNVDMVNDGKGCPKVVLSASYHWKSADEGNYKSDEMCYRENSGLENKPCKDEKPFICETYKENGCQMSISNITVFDFKTLNQPTVTNCATLCNDTDGCFLTGAMDSTSCGMLLTPDVANVSVAVKTCSYVFIEFKFDHNIIPDKTREIALSVGKTHFETITLPITLATLCIFFLDIKINETKSSFEVDRGDPTDCTAVQDNQRFSYSFQKS